ncbi:MAG TPA: hypothetical protein VKF60_13735 [Myxococcota bacterium]|nr:hypothetical protein [Myxococcota bacterium]
MKKLSRMRLRMLAVLLVVIAPAAADSAALSGDLLVQSQTPGFSTYRIAEYRLDGTSLQAIPQQPRDIVVSSLGEIHVYDGTSARLIESGRWSSFVAFVPEPSAAALIASSFALLVLARNCKVKLAGG